MIPARVAAVYDLHGNLPALEAVLADIERAGADRIVVGGDVVPGPMPGESLEALLAAPVPVDFLRGNGEREVLAVREGLVPSAALPEGVQDALRWVARTLAPEHARLMAEWAPSVELDVRGIGTVLFCHATPVSDTEIFTRSTPAEALLPVFEAVEADLVVCGHTHMQFDRSVGGVRVVNAGSVGMPFGEPGAYWLLLASGVELRRTAYDLEAAAERIRATPYPQAAEFAEGNVLRPPSAAEMEALFEHRETRP